jgi:hypothetical protein
MSPNGVRCGGRARGGPLRDRPQRRPVVLPPPIGDALEVRTRDPELGELDPRPARHLGEAEIGDRIVALRPSARAPGEHDPTVLHEVDDHALQRVVVVRDPTPGLRHHPSGRAGKLCVFLRVHEGRVDVLRRRAGRYRLSKILHGHGFLRARHSGPLPEGGAADGRTDYAFAGFVFGGGGVFDSE